MCIQGNGVVNGFNHRIGDGKPVSAPQMDPVLVPLRITLSITMSSNVQT